MLAKNECANVLHQYGAFILYQHQLRYRFSISDGSK